MRFENYLKKIYKNKKNFFTIIIILILFLLVHFFTSGDLAPLGHLALVLIGEGEVFFKGKRLKTHQVLKKRKSGRYL